MILALNLVFKIFRINLIKNEKFCKESYKFIKTFKIDK